MFLPSSQQLQLHIYWIIPYQLWLNLAELFKQSSLICQWSLLLSMQFFSLLMMPFLQQKLDFKDSKNDFVQITDESIDADKLQEFQEKVGSYTTCCPTYISS